MSSNSISFSVTGFSDIMYGAAILTGIYAGVTIMREFFTYKKEELYVHARLMPPTKFDIAGDIRSREDDKFVCGECLLRKKYAMKSVCDASDVNSSHNTKSMQNVQRAQIPQNTQTTPKVQTVVEKKPHTNPQNLLTRANLPNDTLAEVVDLGDNGFHLLEEYGG